MPKKSPTPSHAPLASTAADLRRLRENSAATGAELREFLESIRGTSPSEALGALAQSSLFRSTILSAILLAAILALTTVIPHLLSPAAPSAPEAGEGSPAAAGPAATADEGTGSAPEADAPAPAAAVPPDAPPDPASTAESLGIGEQRDAPANVNPLESLADDLLKDLE